jgi:hypothetical protein
VQVLLRGGPGTPATPSAGVSVGDKSADRTDTGRGPSVPVVLRRAAHRRRHGGKFVVGNADRYYRFKDGAGCRARTIDAAGPASGSIGGNRRAFFAVGRYGKGGRADIIKITAAVGGNRAIRCDRGHPSAWCWVELFPRLTRCEPKLKILVPNSRDIGGDRFLTRSSHWCAPPHRLVVPLKRHPCRTNAIASATPAGGSDRRGKA